MACEKTESTHEEAEAAWRRLLEPLKTRGPIHDDSIEFVYDPALVNTRYEDVYGKPASKPVTMSYQQGFGSFGG